MSALALQPSEDSFASIVQEAQSGNKGATGEFIEHFKIHLMSYLSRMIKNSDIAQDLYGALVEKVFEKLPATDKNLQKERCAKGWIITIAHNLVCDYLRVCKRLECLSLEETRQKAQAGNIPASFYWRSIENESAISAEETYFKNEREVYEEAFFLKLQTILIEIAQSDRQGWCFYEKDVLGQPACEIATALGISESAARAYASKGRKKFLPVLTSLREAYLGVI